jgi:hypothetical protein
MEGNGRHSDMSLIIMALAKLSAGLAKVKTQHPQETGTLDAITVGGILAPNQVIRPDTNLL